MKTICTFILLQVLATCCLFAYNEKCWRTTHDVSYSNIDGFPVYPKYKHQYVLGRKCTIDTLGYEDYSIHFYVNTGVIDYSFAKDSLFRFSRIEFYYKDTKLATFDSDECWTYIERKQKEPKMFCAHKIGNDLAIIIHGELWMNSAQSFNVFILHDKVVSLVFSKPNQIDERQTKGEKSIYRCMCEPEGEYSEAKYSTITIDSQSINVTYDSDKVEKRVYTVNKYKNVKSVGKVNFNGLQSREQILQNLYSTDIPWNGGNKEISIVFNDLVMECLNGKLDTIPSITLEDFRMYIPNIKIDIK